MELYSRNVHYYETDKMGITHHSNYIRWMEEARVDYLAKIGLGYEKLEAMGIASPVTRVECNYKAPTEFADIVTIKVTLEEFKGIRLKIKYEMFSEDGKLVCDARSEHCFLSTEGKPIRLNREFPEVYDIVTKYVEQE